MTKPREPWYAEFRGRMPKEKALRVLAAYTEFLREAPVNEVSIGFGMSEIIKRPKPRRQELVIGRGTKLCNKCHQIEANCRCKRAKD